MGRYRRHSTDSKAFYKWLDNAYEDILAAGILKQEKECWKLALFHCHQCIEKALKAYLVFKTNHLPDGHNLTWLCKQAVSHDDSFTQWLDESAVLNKCYIQTRYPNDIPFEVSDRRIETSYRMADEMFLFICEQMEEDLMHR